jgi:thioredoxin-like negative regulator of GroEL
LLDYVTLQGPNVLLVFVIRFRMAEQSSNDTPFSATPAPVLNPPSPAERSRLSKCFKSGSDNLRKGNYEYAVELFASCVAGDPASPVYAQAFLEALAKKFAGKKKKGALSSLLAAGSRGNLKRLVAAGDIRKAVKTGLDTLKNNPDDIACILGLADACGAAGCLDTQGWFLRRALDVAPRDVSVNKHCAAFKERLGEFEQAVACWQRIADNKGVKELAEREIARLSVEKAKRKLEGRDSKPQQDGEQVSPVEQLRKRLAVAPTDTEVAFELADLLEREEGPEAAEEVLTTILAATGNALKVQEHLEDRRLRWAKRRVMIAEKNAEQQKTATAQETLAELQKQLLKQEIDIYSARVERYPENSGWKFELAMRLKAANRPADAISFFQKVQQDTRRKGLIALEVGECFQKIKQYRLALQNYQLAVDELDEREVELRKRALYRAGVLAAAMKDLDAAHQYLSTLAGIDFNYRDVAERLTKISTGAS